MAYNVAHKKVEANVVLAAYERGWSATKISLAAGVTRQRICQILIKNGLDPNKERRHPGFGGKRIWKCRQCGKFFISRPSAADQLCSYKCMRAARREITDDEIETAIQMRYDGKSWVEIGRALGRVHYQSIQIQIWKYLYIRGELNGGIVRSIWMANRYYRDPSWAWIENRLGFYLQPDGTVTEGKPLNKDRHNSWGGKITGKTPNAPNYPHKLFENY